MKSKNILYIIITTIVASLAFWSIFAFNIPKLLGFGDVSMETIFANYDGPNYMVISKCLYVKDCIGPHYSLPLPLEYYPAHFPAYPLLIKLFNVAISGPWAMLLVNLLGGIILNIAFYQLAKKYFDDKIAFILTLIFTFFPARLFVLRQVGAPETWFLATTIISLICFKDKKYWLSALFAALSQAFKSPGVLLLAAYFILFLKELFTRRQIGETIKNYLPYTLVPLTILGIFYFYYLQTGDFLAYFHSGDNFHLNLLPYQVFISNKSWINSIWLEDIIYIYLLGIIGVQMLWKRDKSDPVTLYSLIFLIATLLVAHRDISRYAAPLYPMLLLAYGKDVTKKPVITALILLLPAIVLYAINFVVGNTAPVADWTPYL